MPFTLSHTVAALPFRWLCPKYLSFAAIVCGTMAPDFGYYIHAEPFSAYSHTVSGSFLSDIPVAALLLAAFYAFRKPIAQLLPGRHCEYWQGAPNEKINLNLKTLFVIAISAFIGTWTHIAWDSMTHSSGAVVMAFPALSNKVAIADGLIFPVYKLLQYSFSALGLGIILFYYQHQINGMRTESLAEENTSLVFQKLARLGIIAGTTAFISVSITYATWVAKPSTELSRLGFDLLVNSMSIFAVLLILVAVLMSRLSRSN